MTPAPLLCVTAHPDDESLGFGGTLARYAAEGIETHLLTATRGERGRYGEARIGDGTGRHPGPERLARIREAELEAAARALGVTGVRILGYPDGGLDEADPAEVRARIAGHIRALRPAVVVTFDPFGAYGHPDHIAISQLTTAAVMEAAHPGGPDEAPPHAVAKLYYMAWTEDIWDAYQAAFKRMVAVVDGRERRASAWPDWAVSAEIDTIAHWPAVWEAVQCHASQTAVFERLRDLDEAHHRALWGRQQFYRAFSTVNGGRGRETDLFEGLRTP